MTGEEVTVRGLTLGARVRHAREMKTITSPAALARMISAAGYPISRQAVAAIERDEVAAPRMGLMEVMGAVLGLTPEELLYGPQEGDSLFVAAVRGLEEDLTDHQRNQLLNLANAMAKESRERRAAAKGSGISEEEMEWIQALRSASPEQRRDVLAARRGG